MHSRTAGSSRRPPARGHRGCGPIAILAHHGFGRSGLRSCCDASARLQRVLGQPLEAVLGGHVGTCTRMPNPCTDETLTIRPNRCATVRQYRTNQRNAPRPSTRASPEALRAELGDGCDVCTPALLTRTSVSNTRSSSAPTSRSRPPRHSTDLLGERLGGLVVDVGDHDRRTTSCELPRARRADALAPRDQRGAAGQVGHPTAPDVDRISSASASSRDVSRCPCLAVNSTATR